MGGDEVRKMSKRIFSVVLNEDGDIIQTSVVIAVMVVLAGAAYTFFNGALPGILNGIVQKIQAI